MLPTTPARYPGGARATVVPRPAVTDVEDYRGSGDTDTTAVRKAFAAAPAGTTLRFAPRTYDLLAGSPFTAGLSVTKAMTLVGTGAVLRAAASGPDGCRILQIVAGDVVVDGLKFDGNGVPSVTCTYAAGMSGLTVRNSRFVNPGSGALCINDHVSDVSFLNNDVTGGGYGVLVNDQPGNTRITVDGNRFRGLGSGGDSDGIEFNGVNNDLTEVIVTNNRVSNYIGGNPSTGFGIALARVVGGTVSGNVVSDCSRNGIHIEALASDVTVTGNMVTRTNHAGIEVQGEAAKTCQRITITGNVVKNCCLAPSANLGRGGIEIGSSTEAIDHGYGADSCMVASNIVVGCQGAGIYLWQANNSSAHHNIVSNTYGPSTDTIHAVHNAGIHVISCTNSMINFNRCHDSQGTPTQYYPIVYYGGAGGTTSAGNFTAGCIAQTLDLTTGIAKALDAAGGAVRVDGGALRVGFYNGTPVVKPAVSGSKNDGTALASLLSQLSALGLITDSST